MYKGPLRGLAQGARHGLAHRPYSSSPRKPSHEFKVTQTVSFRPDQEPEHNLVVQSKTGSKKDLIAYLAALTLKAGVEDAQIGSIIEAHPLGSVVRPILTMKVNADTQEKLARFLGEAVSEVLNNSDKDKPSKPKV